MAKQLPKRLSYEDAAFLNMEQDASPMNVGSVGIYEGVVSYADFLAHADRRIDPIPRYRQRLVPAPLNLVHPAWTDDPHFDITRHIRPVTLPAPGGKQQLIELASRFFAEPLSRDKPLWEILLVDGLSGGYTAHVAKVHHCLVDGVAGVELLAALLDVEPKPLDREPRQARPAPPPLPTGGALWFDALADRWMDQARINAEIAVSLTHPLSALHTAGEIIGAFGVARQYLALAAPQTPWNHDIVAPSRLAWQSLPFAEVHDVAQELGSTINDVVLASLAGALGRFLEELGEPAEGMTLRAACPVNVRSDGEDLGNRVSFMLVGLPAGVADPRERLRHIHQETASMKDAGQASGLDAFLRNLGRLPPFYQAMIARGLSAPNPISNLVCTNIPGPLQPLYLMEHRMVEHYPWVPLGWRMGLAVAVMSYDTRVWFGIVADRDVPGDLDHLATYLVDCFHELAATTPLPAQYRKDSEAAGQASAEGNEAVASMSD